jgi:hypothetical protein
LVRTKILYSFRVVRVPTVLRLGDPDFVILSLSQNQGALTHVSTYPTTPTQQAAPAPSKPATLMAALGATLLAGLAALVNGIMIVAGGEGLAKDIAINVLAREAGVSVDRVKESSIAVEIGGAKIHEILEGRGYIVLVGGALVLLFGLFMMKAALWARIMVTISALLPAAMSYVIATDDGTTLMIALGWVAVVASALAIVLAWLPANGRYAKARKQA